MRANARSPALGRHASAWSRVQRLGCLRVHGARRDPQAQLEPQFIGDAPLALREVLTRHLPDARWQLHWDRGPSRGRCAVPEQSEPLAPPPHEGLGLDDSQHGPSLAPPGQPHQSDTRRGVTWGSWYRARCFRRNRCSAARAGLGRRQRPRKCKTSRSSVHSVQASGRTEWMRLDRRGIAVALLDMVSAHLRLWSWLRAPVSCAMLTHTC